MDHNKIRRIPKACDRCRLKKVRCNGDSPCLKCATDNAICHFGERFTKRCTNTGYVEHLEYQRNGLVLALRQAWSKWAPFDLQSEIGADPSVHRMVELLGVTHTQASTIARRDSRVDLDTALADIDTQCSSSSPSTKTSSSSSFSSFSSASKRKREEVDEGNSWQQTTSQEDTHHLHDSDGSPDHLSLHGTSNFEEDVLSQTSSLAGAMSSDYMMLCNPLYTLSDNFVSAAGFCGDSATTSLPIHARRANSRYNSCSFRLDGLPRDFHPQMPKTDLFATHSPDWDSFLNGDCEHLNSIDPNTIGLDPFAARRGTL